MAARVWSWALPPRRSNGDGCWSRRLRGGAIPKSRGACNRRRGFPFTNFPGRAAAARGFLRRFFRCWGFARPAASRNGNSESWSRELALLQRLRRNALVLPEDLVRQFASARSQSLGAWEAARASDNFALFAGPFDRLLALVRERAQALASGGDPYDALLDEYEL